MKRQQHFQLNLLFSYHELLLIISLYGNVHQNNSYPKCLTMLLIHAQIQVLGFK